jgi:hypothetical protein
MGFQRIFNSTEANSEDSDSALNAKNANIIQRQMNLEMLPETYQMSF